MKITIERPLTEKELKVVMNLLEANKDESEKDDKKTCRNEDNFELWFF